MLQRKAYELIDNWKKAKTKQALLVTGARQVGKTFIVRDFARKNYNNFIEINLVEMEDARNSFSKANSADDLIFRISIFSEVAMVPNETVIFIDEVQECPEIERFIKPLVDAGKFDFIFSGSMLGVALENFGTLPLGYISQIKMYPLDFEEFCYSEGIEKKVFEQLNQYFQKLEVIPDFLHERLIYLFLRYLLVGGMPTSILAYKENKTLDQPRRLLENIHNLYKADISKYAKKNQRLVIKNIYELIASEIRKDNRRFRISSIDEVKRFSSIENEFLWLTNANVALAAYNVSALETPMLINTARSLFKLYYSDIG
ncbi:MAG: ATP-binding protein, partial [Anaerovoracaceae bacterium]